jgi:hypothetical protein
MHVRRKSLRRAVCCDSNLNSGGRRSGYASTRTVQAILLENAVRDGADEGERSTRRTQRIG